MNIFFAAAAVCAGYYIVTLFVGGFSVFPLVWLVLGAVFGGFGCLKMKSLKLTMILPVPVRWTVFGIFIVCAVLFCAVEGMIIKTGLAGPQNNADYIIILGAQVKGEVPSQVLYLRVMKAVEYLNKNPETMVIVSGGKGSGEAITEAECMRRILLENKIDETRIIMEDQSANTMENLKNSLDITGTNHSFVIATCSFHQYRAQRIARKLGADNISGISSHSNIPLLPNFYFREFFAVLKYYVSGQL